MKPRRRDRGAQAKQERERVQLSLRVPSEIRASLYNAGRVAQARADIARARSFYDASLALRPNDEVSDQRASLTPANALTVPEIATDTYRDHSSVAAVTRCLSTELSNEYPTSPKRAFRAQKVAGFVVLEVSPEAGSGNMTGSFGNVVLYRETTRGVLPVVTLTSLGVSAKNARTGDFTLNSVSQKRVGIHDVVLVEWTTIEGGYCAGCNGSVETKQRWVTVCLPSAGVCPIQARLEYEFRLAPVTKDIEPIEEHETFGFDLAADGAATAVLREGTAHEARASGGHAKVW